MCYNNLMNILIVGNVLKDIYLNLDSRTEQFETDKSGISWLDISFNASEHHFYNRNSSLGGAAVSLEVLQKMNLEAAISNHHLSFSDNNNSEEPEAPAETSRYILIGNDGISYLSPSKFKTTSFTPPNITYDYLFIDRSAELNAKTVQKIQTYLDSSPTTKLIVYYKSFANSHLNTLIKRAKLIFIEHSDSISAKSYAPELSQINPNKVVHLSETKLSYLDKSEQLSINRVDMMTHLSAYSIAAATTLGSLILGFSAEKCLKLARANVENSKLDSSLPLTELEEIASHADLSNNLELIAASLILKGKDILEVGASDDLLAKDYAKLANGIAVSDEAADKITVNGRSVVEYLTAQRIIPGIKISQKLTLQGVTNLSAVLQKYYSEGYRFAKISMPFTPNTLENDILLLAKYAQACQTANLVPVIELAIDGQNPQRTLSDLSTKLADFEINLYAVIFETIL